MNYYLKLLFLLYITVKLSLSGSTGYVDIVVLLLLVSSNVYREKFKNTIYLIIPEILLITYGAWQNHAFIALYAVSVYDLVLLRMWGAVIPVGLGIFIVGAKSSADFIMLAVLSGYFAYIRRVLGEKEEKYREGYDVERQYRYQLEQAKNKLLNASKEVARLTEIKERNRIAREIHDNVGHSIAGILLQLQAALKLRGRDEGKSDELLKGSIEALSGTLEVLRDTVHNIKPNEKLGIDYLKSIIENFAYCGVSFEHTGDFSILTGDIMEILCSNVKEALTNASRYSNASRIDIKVDVTANYTRLYIKDNGAGCGDIKEGLGLSGMRERIYNIGGSMSVSGEGGFLIVCVIPMESCNNISED